MDGTATDPRLPRSGFDWETLPWKSDHVYIYPTHIKTCTHTHRHANTENRKLMSFTWTEASLTCARRWFLAIARSPIPTEEWRDHTKAQFQWKSRSQGSGFPKDVRTLLRFQMGPKTEWEFLTILWWLTRVWTCWRPTVLWCGYVWTSRSYSPLSAGTYEQERGFPRKKGFTGRLQRPHLTFQLFSLLPLGLILKKKSRFFSFWDSIYIAQFGLELMMPLP